MTATTAPVNLLIVTAGLDKGGVEEVVATYARELDKSAFNVTVACFRGGSMYEEIARLPGVRTELIATRSRIGRFLAFWRIARAVRADIVHNHACWYGLLAGVMTGAKRVETVHNVYQWFTGFQRFHYSLYCLLAQRIIAVSDHVLSFTLRTFRWIPPRKCITIYNGIQPGRFAAQEGRNETRASLGIGADELVVGFVGRLTEQKGLPYLLAAVAQLGTTRRPFRLLIVGDGELRSSIEAEAEALGITTIVFAGYQRETARFYRAFDLFVLPSLWEGLPVSLIEAMASGCAVIATRVGGSPELVEQGVSGMLVEPKDPSELAEAIRVLLTDRAKREAMGRAARERVEREFSAQRMVGRTVELYRQLLTGERPG